MFWPLKIRKFDQMFNNNKSKISKYKLKVIYRHNIVFTV